MKDKYCTLNNSKLIWKVDKTDKDIVHLSKNNKKVVTNINNICILENYTPNEKTKVSIVTSSNTFPSEIMLRHKTKLDALEELDRFIDNAIVGNIPRVKIIHGKHGGIIRNAVHEYLDNHPSISSYNFGDYHEGGFGVTIAYIKRYN